MSQILQRLLVLSLFAASLGLGACTNARDGGGGMDSSGTAGSSSGSSTGGTAPPTM